MEPHTARFFAVFAGSIAKRFERFFLCNPPALPVGIIGHIDSITPLHYGVGSGKSIERAAMRTTHLDWLSFTLETPEQPRTGNDLLLLVQSLIKEHKDHELLRSLLLDGQTYSPAVGRTPYRIALANSDSSIRLLGSSPTDTVLIEISGRTASEISDFDTAQRLLIGVMDRVTRVDIAVDVFTGTGPIAFTSAGYNNRFRTSSQVVSSTGETVYVGSRKSDRYCRVYRYSSPHPRSDRLRVEYVFRGKLARVAIVELKACRTWADIASRLGATYEWRHPDYYTTPGTSGIGTGTVEPSLSDETVSWLYRQVAPAIVRLVNERAISLTDFIEYLYTNKRKKDSMATEYVDVGWAFDSVLFGRHIKQRLTEFELTYAQADEMLGAKNCINGLANPGETRRPQMQTFLAVCNLLELDPGLYFCFDDKVTAGTTGRKQPPG